MNAYEALLIKARKAVLAGELDSAYALLDEAAKKPDGDHRHLLMRGLIYYEEEDYASALKWFKQAVKAYPHSALAWSHLSVCALRLGEVESALEFANKAVEKKPRQGVYLDLQGRLLLLLDRPQEALESYRLALNYDSEDYDALCGACWACLYTGFREEGERFLLKIEDIDADNPEAGRIRSYLASMK
ncbi:MAG: tetratricopeptide repeat protein [Candidatus Altiarchaeales archaeon]|nr:tetratricopeptide repeat protein [Candidatus Altiarchaeales archaeon]